MSNEVTTSMLGTDKIAEALCKAQAEIKGAEKSANNPAFKRDGKNLKYATLFDIWEACREPLTKNGLAVAQLVSSNPDGVCVETRLLHSSGQSLSSSLTLPLTQRTPQAVGSALTYGRRYGLAAMVGVCPDEDDDGNAASQGQHREEPRQQDRRVTPQDERGHGQAPQAGSISGDMTEKHLDGAIAKVFKEIRGIIPEITAATLREEANLPTKGTLTVAQKQTVLRAMEQRLKEMRAAMEGDPPPPPDEDIPY